MPMQAGLHSVEGMENVLNFLSVFGQVSAVLFGVMIVMAMALAGLSSYQRNHRRRRGA